jgi:predicted Zn-dependent peptidase
VGSRYETKGEEGLSHFIEHMMFKGTRNRTASQISNEIDALGGEMNAFTTHEATAFYVKVLDQQAGAAFDLLADLFHHSRFGARDIEKEKQIVIEEIRTVQDDPEDYIHELHAKDVLGNHSIGRPILGTSRAMRQMSRRALLQYKHKHYRPENTIVAVAGNFSFSQLLDQVNEYFGQWQGEGTGTFSRKIENDRWPDQPKARQSFHQKPLEQVHLCVGFKGLPIGHPDRYMAHVLNAILGGGVSSRLFQEVPAEVGGVIDQICKETQKLCRRGVAVKELERTKTQLKGSLMLGLEGTNGRMNKLAKDELYQGRHVSLQEMVKAIDRISPEQIRQISQKLLDLKDFVALDE